MAFFECNDLRILLSIPESKQYDHPSSIVYFNVEEIQSSYEELQERGVTFQGEPHMISKMGETEVWMAFFRDPDGNTHAILSEVAV